MRRPTPTTIFVTLLALTGLIHASLLFAPPLAWDDDSNIFANPHFLAGRWAVFWRSDYFGLYVPLTSLVWQTLYTLGAGAAWPFRALNVGLHLTNVVLVHQLIRRGSAPRAGAWAAVIGAGLFALHPLQVATVAWISGGRDLLAACFALTATAAFFSPARGGRLVATAAYAAAVLSKPSAVVLPAVIAALGWRRSSTPTARGRTAWLLAWSGLGAAVTLWTLRAQDAHLGRFAWWQHAWLAGDAYWFYQRHLIQIFDLAANYARTPDVVLANPATLIGAALGVILPAGLAWWSPTLRPLVAAWAWLLLPVSGVVSFGYQETSGVADHYAYLSLAVVGAGVTLALSRRPSRAGFALAAAALCIGAGQSLARLGDYASNARFFDRMAKTAPASFATALGLSAVDCAERGDFAAGTRWSEAALTARPDDARALANLAYCRWHAGDVAGTAALARMLPRLDRAALARTQPTGYASFLASVGAGVIASGQSDAGYRLLCEARALFPDDPGYARGLAAAAQVLRGRGVTPTCE